MAREIVLDTETTGLDAKYGDRIVEIGCVELINHVPTGAYYHQYINPERDMPIEAYHIHGLSVEFLSDKPVFGEVSDDLLNFLGNDVLVIHNAPFDMGFLNKELEHIGQTALKNPVIDTVHIAREKHPGARVSLDALCKHYGIDNSKRTKHGALLDSEILADVYLELLGGRQVALKLSQKFSHCEQSSIGYQAKKRNVDLVPRLNEEILTKHDELIDVLGEKAIWHKYQ